MCQHKGSKTPPSPTFPFRRRARLVLWGSEGALQYSTKNSSERRAGLNFMVGWREKIYWAGALPRKGLTACKKATLSKGREKATETCHSSLGTPGTGCLFSGAQFTRDRMAAPWGQACKSQGKGGIQAALKQQLEEVEPHGHNRQHSSPVSSQLWLRKVSCCHLSLSHLPRPPPTQMHI